MNSRPSRVPLLLAAGAVILAGVIAFVMLGGEKKSGDSRGGAPETGVAEAPVAPASTDARPAESKSGRDAAERSDAAAEAGAIPVPASVARALSGIVGRVVEPDGRPVAGATAELLGGLLDFFTVDPVQVLFRPEEFDPRITEQKTKTDADGRFRFAKVDPRLYFLVGINLGHGRPAIRFVDRTPNPG